MQQKRIEYLQFNTKSFYANLSNDLIKIWSSLTWKSFLFKNIALNPDKSLFHQVHT